MARIAGLLGPWPAARSAQALGGMLAAFRLPTPQVQTVTSGEATLGASASQPVAAAVCAADALIAVIDGCIFNAGELAGTQASAAEIVVDLYRRYGFKGALERINGDFAIALYDARSGSLWLGRDRIGVRPLYYCRSGELFGFASQPRPLLAVPGISHAVNPQFVALFAGSHYRTFDNRPEQSPFADIAQLPAAHLLEVCRDGRQRLDRYWDLQQEPDFDASESELAEQYRELLLDAVRLRLGVAPAPGFLLSGGMDSSSVLASAVRFSGKKQHAFSSVYEDRTYDESAEIRSMLDSAVAEWHPIQIAPPDLPAVVDRMVRAHDEPVATATWLSHFLLCEEAAARGFQTLFGGLGGDELNAGEYEYFFFKFADLRRAQDESTLRHEVTCWAQHHDHPIYRKNMSVVEEALGRLVDLRSPGLCLPDRLRLERYASTVNPEFFDLRAFAPEMDHRFVSYLKNRTYQDIFRETAPCCLRAEDRQTTAFGLQHFDPFFDHRLVEFMFRVPAELKIRDGVTKVLLREATRGLLPEETRTRIKKTGWNAPAHVWFSGRTLDTVRDLVRSQSFKERGIYNVAVVERIVDEHEAIVRSNEQRENHMMFLWQLLNLELWLRSVHE